MNSGLLTQSINVFTIRLRSLHRSIAMPVLPGGARLGDADAAEVVVNVAAQGAVG